MKKAVTTEMVQKWLNDKIKLQAKLAVDLKFDDDYISVCGAITAKELYIYRAKAVKKLAEFLELPYEIHDPWCEQYSDYVEVQFMYGDYRIYGISTKEEYYNEKTEVAD